MSASETKSYTEFILPPSVVSKLDVSRLVAELERVDNELTTATVKTKTGDTTEVHPTMSSQLSDFLQQNDLSIDEEGYRRTELLKQLRLLKDKAPIIHMTFAGPADTESLQQLSAWLRQSIHPQAVITVGLQPSLVAGVYMRTTNKVHDLSLRTKLRESRGLLLKELEAL